MAGPSSWQQVFSIQSKRAANRLPFYFQTVVSGACGRAPLAGRHSVSLSCSSSVCFGGGGRLPITTLTSSSLPLRTTCTLVGVPGLICATVFSSFVVSVISSPLTETRMSPGLMPAPS